MAPDRFFNLGFDLATTISILVLVSLGLAVIFGMRGVINLAHGEFIMLGAFATLTGVRSGLNICWPWRLPRRWWVCSGSSSSG